MAVWERVGALRKPFYSEAGLGTGNGDAVSAALQTFYGRFCTFVGLNRIFWHIIKAVVWGHLLLTIFKILC